jgi:hypothetical protein
VDTFYTSSGTSPPPLLDYIPPSSDTPPSASPLPVLNHERHESTQPKPRLVCPTPKALGFYLDLNTGEYVESRCTRNTCPVCCVINSWGLSRAIRRADPDYSITVTQVGQTWAAISVRMRKFFQELVKYYPTLKYCYSVEPNPQGTGNHAHGYIHTASNETIYEAVVAKAASRAGLGTEFRLVKPQPNSTQSFYGYPTKTLADPAQQATFMALNGTRLTHTSKSGFWRDGKNGPPLTFKRATSRKPYRKPVRPSQPLYNALGTKTTPSPNTTTQSLPERHKRTASSGRSIGHEAAHVPDERTIVSTVD